MKGLLIMFVGLMCLLIAVWLDTKKPEVRAHLSTQEKKQIYLLGRNSGINATLKTFIKHKRTGSRMELESIEQLADQISGTKYGLAD
jgi:hypothetical protein